ncbi:MAG: histidine kinase [Streptosporangiales bacterium]|nr:histidine kinase [Streptosporangiales bacterium]
MTVQSVTDVQSVWQLPDWLVVVPAAASGVVAATARLRLWPLVAVAVAVWLLFAMWPAVFVASYYAATLPVGRVERLRYVVGTTAVVTIPLFVTAAISGQPYVSAGLVTALLIGLPFLVGLWVRMRRQLVAGLRERAMHLERERESRYEQARAEERARIAREMHDVVAHKVSLVVLQAGALAVSAPDESTAEKATVIRSAGREALADLRHVLGVLRSPSGTDQEREPQQTLDDLDELLDRSRAAGVGVGRTDSGDIRPLPAAVDHTAYRIVQEALTNVGKHAGGVPTRVARQYSRDHVEVTVHNERPVRPVSSPPGSGLGLVGLRERARLLGGTLDAGRDADDGFTVHARLPVPEPESTS